jgi:hypothetical protein
MINKILGRWKALDTLESPSLEYRNNLFARVFCFLFAAIGVFIGVRIFTVNGEQRFFQYILLSVAILLLLLVILATIIPFEREWSAQKCYVTLIGLIAVGILLRVLSVIYLQTVPISDFATPIRFYDYLKEHGEYKIWLDWSQMDGYQLYYARYPAWYIFMKYVHFIYRWAGENVAYLQVGNMALVAASLWLVYCITKRFAKSQTALVAVGFLCFNPSMIAYSGIITPDHFAALFILLTVYFFIKVEQYSGICIYKTWIYTVLAAASAITVNLFKPLSILFFIVFLCIELVYRIGPCLCKGGWAKLKTTIKYNCFRWAAFILTFLVCNVGFMGLLHHAVQVRMKNKVVDSTPLYMMWAYSVDQEGRYQPDVATRKYEELCVKYNQNMVKVMDELKALAIQQIKDNTAYIPAILLKKLDIGFADESGFWVFSNTSPDEEYQAALEKTVKELFLAISTAAMLMLYLLMMACGVAAVVVKKGRRGWIVAGITIFGYILVLVLGGVQSRYKSLIIPLMCIVAAVGFENLLAIVKNRRSILK